MQSSEDGAMLVPLVVQFKEKHGNMSVENTHI
jgi:hypothetical protein